MLLSAVGSFYQFHQRHGVECEFLWSLRRGGSTGSWRPFLAHLGESPRRRREVKLKAAKRTPRVLQPHLIHAHMNHLVFGGLYRSIFWKQRDRARLLAILQNIYRAPPGLSLAVVDLTQIENMSLRYTPVCKAMILDDAPVAMFFAIFDTRLLAQKHAAIFYNGAMAARG